MGSLCHHPGTQFFLPRPADPCSRRQAAGTQRCCLVAGDAGSHINAAWALFHQGNWSLHKVSRASKGGLAVGGYPEEQRFRS